MNPVEAYNGYGELSSKIGKFNDIQSQLKEGWEILLAVNEKYGKQHPLYKKFEKEYRDLYETIKKSFDSEKTFSQEQRAKIILELGDVVSLAEKNGIIEKKKWYSSLGDVLRNTDTKQAKESAISFRNKNVKDYSKAEAISAMSYLSENYKNYKDIGNDDKISKLLTFANFTINELDDRYEVRLFQDELVKKIFGEKIQYNKEYVLGFNQEKGNFLVKIEDFEKDLKDDETSIRDINSKALGNYFLYLKSKGQLTGEKVIDIFGANKLYEIRNIWEKKEKGDSLATKQIMQENGLGDIIKIIELFSSPDNFLAGIQEIGKDKKQGILVLKLFEKNTNAIKDEFKKSLKEKFLNSNPGKQAEAEKVINEMIDELKKHKDIQSLPEIFRIFDTYNEKFKLGLSISDEAKKLIKIREQETHIQIVRVEQEKQKAISLKDTKGQERLKKEQERLYLQLTQNQALSGAIQNTPDSDIKKIVSGEISYEDYLDDLMKKDESFKKIIEDLHKQEKNFYEKYPEEKSVKSTEETTISQSEQVEDSSNTFSYSDGTTLTYEQVSSGSYKVNNLTINSDEFDTIKRNKDALKNMENFKQTLEDLNLGGLWKYREPIFKAISNKYTIEFNAKDDYLDTNELKIFLNAILKSIGYKGENFTNLQDIKTQINVFNKVGVLSGMKDVNIHGNSLIEKIFIQKFDTKRTGRIHPHVLEKEISNLFGDTLV